MRGGNTPDTGGFQKLYNGWKRGRFMDGVEEKKKVSFRRGCRGEKTAD